MNIKVLIKGSLIFLAGGGVGFFVSNKFMKNKCSKLEKEIEDTKEFYKGLINGVHDELRNAGWAEEPEEDEPIEDEEDEEESDVDISPREAFMKRRKEMLKHPERIQYETFSSKENSSDENDIYREVNTEALRDNNDNPDMNIYTIDSDKYADCSNGYDKLTLYWWEVERMLTDEDLDILYAPDIIGDAWEQHIGEYEKDVVYVRNNNMKSDYDVIIQHESFYKFRGD